jgi:hypothetical protein
MAHFRPVHIRPSKGREEGWVVERTALGEIRSVVSRVFPSREGAKAEAERLTRQDKLDRER